MSHNAFPPMNQQFTYLPNQARLNTLVSSRLTDPATDGDWYLKHPNSRTLAAFILGAILTLSLQYMALSLNLRACSRTVVRTLQRVRSTRSAASSGGPQRRQTELPLYSDKDDLEAGSPPTPSPAPALHLTRETSSVRRANDFSALLFVLNLCFLFASLSAFFSLLAFPVDSITGSSRGWEGGCAFVVAWAGMAAQIGRLVGLGMVLIEVFRFRGRGGRGVKTVEQVIVWVLVAIAVVFVFVSNATNLGRSKVAVTLGVTLCSRKPYLPTAITSTCLRFAVSLYLLVRLFTLCPSAGLVNKLKNLKWSLAKAGSVLCMDLLTVVPDAKVVGPYAQWVPFGVGCILVLLAFNLPSRRPLASPASEDDETSPRFTTDTKLPQQLKPLQLTTSPSAFVVTLLASPTPSQARSHARGGRSHSWCSASEHLPPRSPVFVPGSAISRTQTMGTTKTNQTSDSTLSHMTGESLLSVEDAVLVRAIRKTIKRFSAPALSVPQSAPPAPSSFFTPSTSLTVTPAQHHSYAGLTTVAGNAGKKITPSQRALAEQLEREMEEEARRQMSLKRKQGGGLGVRRPRKPQISIRIPSSSSEYSGDEHEETGGRADLRSAASSVVYGSDILRAASGKRQRRRDIAVSIEFGRKTSKRRSQSVSTQSRRSTMRLSWSNNVPVSDVSPSFNPSRESLRPGSWIPAPASAVISPRTPQTAQSGRSFLSPLSSVRSPWRLTRGSAQDSSSFASAIRRSRDDLPLPSLPENPLASAPAAVRSVTILSHSTSSSSSSERSSRRVSGQPKRRGTFGFAGSSVRMSSRRKKENPGPRVEEPPVPALPTNLTAPPKAKVTERTRAQETRKIGPRPPPLPLSLPNFDLDLGSLNLQPLAKESDLKASEASEDRPVSVYERPPGSGKILGPRPAPLPTTAAAGPSWVRGPYAFPYGAQTSAAGGDSVRGVGRGSGKHRERRVSYPPMSHSSSGSGSISSSRSGSVGESGEESVRDERRPSV